MATFTFLHLLFTISTSPSYSSLDDSSEFQTLALVIGYINTFDLKEFFTLFLVGLSGLGVKCSPRDLSFAGTNPPEFDGFFQDVKILSTGPSGRTLSWGSRV